MPTNQKRRQKQLERKRAKRKERHRALVKQRNAGLAVQLSEVAIRAPILDSYVSEDVWDQGLGYVLISRQLSDQRVAFASFLVDRYCLGVKDTFAEITTKGDYEERLIAPLESRCELIKVTPATARRLIEDAVAYANGLGLSPHPDYRRTQAIFGDIDPQAAAEVFEMGKDGKPHFIAGPYDTPDRCFRILSALEHACGTDGFHFIMPMLGDEAQRLVPHSEENGLYLGEGAGDENEDGDE
jgi:hypothetical protein